MVTISVTKLILSCCNNGHCLVPVYMHVFEVITVLVTVSNREPFTDIVQS